MASSCIKENNEVELPPSYENVIKDEEELWKEKALRSNYLEQDDRGMVIYVTVDPVSHPDNSQLVSGAEPFATTVNGSEAGLDWIGVSFSDKNIRLSFMRKVFLVLMCQLMVTIGVICLFMFCDPVKNWVRTPQNFWFYYVAYGIFLVTYIVLACCKNIRRQWPGNLICLSVFTLSLSCMAATISSFHDTRIVLVAFGMVVVICLGLTLFALQTRIDFSLCSGLLVAFSLVIFVFGLYSVITGAIVGFKSAHILTGFWGALMALLFSLFLVFDIQQVVGGNSIELNPEEYIYGALHIYLDVVILFIVIVSCSGRS